jgi:mono/diheme cytochrome c family protein
MRKSTCFAALIALAALAVASPAQAQDKGDALPDGVTAEMIAKGRTVFGGAGLCYACHGKEAKGSVGPDLTDAEWLHSKGTYPEIVAQILKGVPKEESKKGIAMPPKGGSSISDDDVKAVAAYVWSLSHAAAEPAKGS